MKRLIHREYHIDLYSDGSCTALGQKPFDSLIQAEEAIDKYIESRAMKISCKQPFVQFVSTCTTPTFSYGEPIECCKATPKEESKPMANDPHTYLKQRIREVYYNLRDVNVKTFHIHDYTGPRTYAEMIDWVKNGKYTLDAKTTAKVDASALAGDFYQFSGPLDGIVWNGRGFTSDYDGYNAAEKDLSKAMTAAVDIVVTGDPAAGLAALQAFEAWTPTVATTTAQ